MIAITQEALHCYKHLTVQTRDKTCVSVLSCHNKDTDIDDCYNEMGQGPQVIPPSAPRLSGCPEQGIQNVVAKVRQQSVSHLKA